MISKLYESLDYVIFIHLKENIVMHSVLSLKSGVTGGSCEMPFVTYAVLVLSSSSSLELLK
jgi:hypothetical protein